MLCFFAVQPVDVEERGVEVRPKQRTPLGVHRNEVPFSPTSFAYGSNRHEIQESSSRNGRTQSTTVACAGGE